MESSHADGNAVRSSGPHSCLRLREGSLLLEAVLSVGVFAIFVGGIGMSLLIGQQSTISGADRVRAVFLAEQGLEGLREVRDEGFAGLTLGTFGIKVGTNGRFALTAQPVVSDGYTSRVILTSRGTNWIEARSKVDWNFGKSRSGSITFSTYLTNWRVNTTSGNWSTVKFVKTFTGGTTAQFNRVLVQGNYAYVTGDRTSGGKGLYVFDISNPAVPTRIATSFDLGVSGYDMTIQGKNLIVATDAASSEVKVFDISAPANLSMTHLSGSYDLPGSGLARRIDSFNGTIYVGTNQNATGNEFYALGLASTGSLRYQSSLNIDANVTDIDLHEGYAYLATSADNAELLVVDVFDPTAIALAPGTGIDLTDVYDGILTHTFGTSALIGRKNGTTISELTLYSVAEAPVPVTPPGPWSLEVGGDASGIDTDPTGTYGFLVSDLSTAELKVLKMPVFSAGGNPVVASYNAPSALKSVMYDWVHDRVFAVSATNLFVFAPGS